MAISVLPQRSLFDRGFRRAFLLDGTEICTNVDLSYRLYVDHEWKPILTKQAKHSRIDELKCLAEALKIEYDEKMNEFMDVREKIKETKQQTLQSSEDELQRDSIRKKLFRLNDQLKNDQNSDEVARTVRINFFEQELVNLEATRSRLCSSIPQLMERIRDNELAVTSLRTNHKSLQCDFSLKAKQVSRLQTMLAKLTEPLHNLKSHEDCLRRKDESVLQLITYLSSEIEKQEEASAFKLSLLTESMGMNGSKKREDVLREIEEAKAHIKRIEEKKTSQENSVRVMQLHRNLYQAVKNTEVQLERDRLMLDRLRTARRLRKSAMRHFKTSIASRCSLRFERFLECRNLRGSLNFDLEHDKLIINIQPITDTSEQKSILGTLSGGERSYGTVCVLVSMWAVSNNPFRFMDEYDVFMDCVNRTVATSLLMETANASEGTQFMIMTPLSTNGINLPAYGEDAKFNKIIKIEKQ